MILVSIIIKDYRNLGLTLKINIFKDTDIDLSCLIVPSAKEGFRNDTVEVVPLKEGNLLHAIRTH